MGECLETVATIRKKRNPWIECVRVLASLAVIFSHCRLPGTVGAVVDCLDRFSVPFFFIVSGYFIYQAGEDTIRKRTNGILKLNVLATLLYLVWGSCKERYIYGGGRMPWLMGKLTLKKLARWILNCENPFAEHLWYLGAMLVCYIVLRIYIRWYSKPYSYKSLYIVSVFLMAVHVVLGSGAVLAGLEVPYVMYRNALFYGIPMFSLGIFIREYESHIMTAYALTPVKLIGILLAGAALSLLEWFGIGKPEMPFGIIFVAIALMLLLTSAPRKAAENKAFSAMTAHFADLSAYVYVTHIVWKNIYDLYGMPWLAVLVGDKIEYMRPFAVALLSILTGCVWLLLKKGMKQAAGKMRFK